MDPSLVFLLAVVATGWGTGVSFIQERFGDYDVLPPWLKQIANALVTAVLPYAAAIFQPFWKPEFGTIEEVVTSLAILLAPVIAWVVGQFAHHFDPARFIAGRLSR